MAVTHNLGYPRIGSNRELKFALEDFWHGKIDYKRLEQIASDLRQRHWQAQAELDWLPVGDFSLYDHVLDTSFLLGNIPERVQQAGGDRLAQYFRTARGIAGTGDTSSNGVAASEMTKWFDSNYHYIVPEFHSGQNFSLHSNRLLQHIREAHHEGHAVKPVLLGPVSYLWLGKSSDGSNRLQHLDALLEQYRQLFDQLDSSGIDWLQIDEPALVTDLESDWQQAFERAYSTMVSPRPRLLLATYFGELGDNLPLVTRLLQQGAIDGLHLDATRARHEVDTLKQALPSQAVLSLGVIDGRNIWRSDLDALLAWLQPLHQTLQNRLWLAPSCSLLHVPVSLATETALDNELRSWLAFAEEKLAELHTLAKALNTGLDSVADSLAASREARATRQRSQRVHRPAVQQRLAAIDAAMEQRHSVFAERERLQSARFTLPVFPTTTIGSFPQTADIRRVRRQYRNGDIDQAQYETVMRGAIADCIREQEMLGLDVLVHGEAERNDMVEYFGEQLEGYAFTQNGWVQSYGSRCVKPPILYGDIHRTHSMTVHWIRHAQSLTDKPVKGMLTGPVTLLNWSFVRDDQPRSTTCLQLALAVRDEVLDLEAAGISIIQIDEAALREGLPLRRSQWSHYLDWAVRAFRLCANGVQDSTQIHTHMCYSEFNDIIEAIADMDADVITIETSRSHMELLDVFEAFDYPNQIGPGVFDIHSPRIPSVEAMVELIQQAARRIPPERLWINPDCGLKTRQWNEVLPALRNMVAASRQLRERQTAMTTP